MSYSKYHMWHDKNTQYTKQISTHKTTQKQHSVIKIMQYESEVLQNFCWISTQTSGKTKNKLQIMQSKWMIIALC